LYHAPIHNDTKLAEWEQKGAVIVNSLDEVPDEALIYFSAHGVSPNIWPQAKQKRLNGKDASCPLVEKGHREVRNLNDEGFTILLVGHKNHDEINGIIDEASENIIIVDPNSTFQEVDKLLDELQDKEKLALRSQTTLAVSNLESLIDYIKTKRPDLNLPNKSDICYATENRQEAVIVAIVSCGVDLMIIFGSDETKRQPSSNSIRLREVSEKHNVKAHLVENVAEIQSEWFEEATNVGVSAGASGDPKRVAEFLVCLCEIGLKSNQLQRVTVADEPQVFTPARSFDFSK
jgi:4-hydroxy-3-methylbut-2-enyl diphosphate reductase